MGSPSADARSSRSRVGNGPDAKQQGSGWVRPAASAVGRN
jgi:hypothetical protein